MVDQLLSYAASLLAGTIYLFCGLAVLCDNFLVPNIEFLCNRFRIPDEVAGATLLALGAAAPELAIMSVATIYGTPDVGSDVLLISSMIAFGAIPAFCILSVRKTLTLQVKPLLRDTTFYIIGLATLIYMLKRNGGVMVWQDNVILVVEYFVYLGVIAARASASFEEEEDTRRTHIQEKIADDGLTGALMKTEPESGLPTLKRSRSRERPLSKEKSKDGEDDEQTCLGKAYEKLTTPYEVAFKCVTFELPETEDDEDAAPVWKVAVSTFMSLVMLAVLSKLSYDAVEALVKSLSLEGGALGSTLLAIGSQVPDTIGAIAMTKSDMADGAISSAIGSQVMQMTFGVGAPWLVYNWYYGAMDLQAGGGLGALFVLLPVTGVTVGAYFLLVVLPGIPSLLTGGSHATDFKMGSGLALLVVFVCAMTYSILDSGM